MNKKYFAAAALACALMSCGTGKNSVAVVDFTGEWNIVEVNGEKVSAENAPFLGFDKDGHRLYGNAGCNRLMGSFELDTLNAGKVKFGQVAATRMMCPDMTTENNVLNAFAQVKGYKKAGKDKVYLCNSSNRPVVVLQKKEADVKLSVLNGEWKIKEVNGEAIPSGMEKQPFIAFDVKKKTIHGNAGCNLINGGFETSTSNAKSISFPGVASTMMACPDMETEGKVLKAINEVKSFDVLSGGGIGLYDANGALVIVLEK